MFDILFAIARYAVAVGVGVVIGIMFTRGKTKHDHTVPFVEKNDRNFTLVVVVLLTFSLIAVINTAVATNEQAACNDEFRSALQERANITTEDNKLRDRQAALNNEDAVALRDFLKVLLTNPGEAGRAVTMASLQNFQVVINDNSVERDNIIVEQQKLEQKRKDNPYPEPCNK